MEYYESQCLACGHSWQWVGIKTAMEKMPTQIAATKVAGTKCPRCGGAAEVSLDHVHVESKMMMFGEEWCHYTELRPASSTGAP